MENKKAVATFGWDGSMLIDFVANREYRQREVIPIVTRVMDQGDQCDTTFMAFADALKKILRQQCVAIDGLNSGFRRDGGMFEHLAHFIGTANPVPTRTNQTSEIVLDVAEMYGLPIDSWVRYWDDMIENFVPVHTDSMDGTAMIQEAFNAACTVDILFVEPDVTGQVLFNAWHAKNVYIAEYDGVTGKFFAHSTPKGGEAHTHRIKFNKGDYYLDLRDNAVREYATKVYEDFMREQDFCILKT